jgi:hypothetical protein
METMKDDRKNMKDKGHEFGTGAGPDFGADSDVVPESDPRFDAWITKMAPTLNAPNAAPRAEMWDAIRAAQQQARDAQAGLVPGVTPLRRTWRLMSVIAAALLLGVAIDRLALRRVDQRVASTGSDTNRKAPAEASTTPSRLYRVAAAQTLTQAEALLVAYRAGDVPSRDRAAARQLGSWGRQVLSSTRLLLDSPAGDDPQLRSLLDDLELVLVQIIQLSGAPLDTSERALIDRARERALIDGALQDRNLLPRIRTAVPAGVAAAASSE